MHGQNHSLRGKFQLVKVSLWLLIIYILSASYGNRCTVGFLFFVFFGFFPTCYKTQHKHKLPLLQWSYVLNHESLSRNTHSVVGISMLHSFFVIVQ